VVRPSARRVLLPVAIWCLLLQIASAAIVSRPLDTPNASTEIARNLVDRGEYGTPAWTVLRGPAAVGDRTLLRAYQLPGEPLYLAAGFLVLPPAARRYLHVPIAVLLVVAVTAVALATAGRRVALIAGALLSVDPFLLVHGPVWDDTILAAALEWSALALMFGFLELDRSDRRHAVLRGIGLAGLAGLAAVTRLHAQMVLVLVACSILLLSRRFGLARLQPAAVAALIGVTIALGAWGGRNAAVLGRVFVGSTHDGVTLFRANYVTALPSILRTGTAEWFDDDRLAPQYAAVAGASELDADAYYRRSAVQYARAHPLDVLRTAGVKLVASLTGADLGQPARSLRNTVFVGFNLALLVAAGAALIMRAFPARDRRASRLLACAAAAMTLVTVVLLAAGPVGFRYRIDLTGLSYLLVAGLAATHPMARRLVRT